MKKQTFLIFFFVLLKTAFALSSETVADVCRKSADQNIKTPATALLSIDGSGAALHDDSSVLTINLYPDILAALEKTVSGLGNVPKSHLDQAKVNLDQMQNSKAAGFLKS